MICSTSHSSESPTFEVTPEIVEELFGEEEVVDVPGTNLITALLFYGTISISIVTVVSGLLAAALATRIVRPLRQLTNVAHDVARGDLAVRASQRIRGRGRSTRTTSREVADLVDALDDALENVEQVYDHQRRFVENAAHELRGPITSTRAILDVATAHPHAYDTAELIEEMGRNNQRAEKFIDSLLQMATIGETRIEPTPVKLGEVVAEAIAAVPRHIDVSYQQGSDSLISADPALTHTVVENLLQNATKYNSPDGWVRACQGV